MTYHPIDKPTEPGLYWFQGVVGRPYLCRVDAMMRVDGMMSEVGAYGGPPSHISNMPGTWYGPKVESPQKYEARMAPEAPRRFRCRCVGESTWGVFDGHKYFVMLPSSLSFSASLEPPQEIEWLDPEPEKPPKAKTVEWPRLFRWRNTISITSVTYGFGLYFREADEYVVLLGNGTMKVCKHSTHEYEIFEWLDKETA